MKSVAIFMCLFAATAAITCKSCMELDWGSLNTTELGLNTTIEGMANCTVPGTEECETGMKCMNGTLTQTLSGTENGTAWSLDMTYVAKTCMATNETCNTLSTWLVGQMNSSDMNATFKSCDIDLCDENSTSCTEMATGGSDNSGAATFCLVLVSVIAVLRLM